MSISDIYQAIDDIARSAAEREDQRTIAPHVVSGLKEAGFGRLRIPESYGGWGLSLGDAFPILCALATADSNIAQALRPHFLAVEKLLITEDSEFKDHWLRIIGDEGVLIGNALTEKGNALGTLSTTLRRNGSSFLLDGTKFYSTGSMYADWIQVLAATEDGSEAFVFVPRDAPGVTLHDDWDGFGQQLTASGTTDFSEVRVEAADVQWVDYTAPSVFQALAQAHHLSSLTGIARAVVEDFREYVVSRNRVFSTGNRVLPKDDPQVQQILGEAEATAAGVEAVFAQLVHKLDAVHEKYRSGTASEDELASIDLEAAKAQLVIAPLVLQQTSAAFEVGGDSALSQGRRLDRHWRNARVLSSHNPMISRAKLVGSALLHGGHEARQYTVGTAKI